MSVQRFRSIEDMPKPWRDPDDPENLRIVAQMMALYRRLHQSEASRKPGVRRFETLQELNADRDDFYRRENPRLDSVRSFGTFEHFLTHEELKRLREEG